MKKFFVVFLFLCAFFVISCDNGSKSITPDKDSETSNDEDADSVNDSDETDTAPQNNDGDSGDTLNDNDSSLPDDSDSNDSENPVTDSDTPATDDDSEPADDNDADGGDPEEDDEPVVIVEGLDYESGFIDLEENSYTLSNKSSKSGRAKMWYYFQPANKNPQDKPLFVFYNGGPGSSSALIFLYNTAKKTADQAFAGDGIADNKWNWNQLGNLLYVDARQTGFSYGIVDNPSNSNARSNYFSTANFNVFVDASDFIRVILRFLDNHPKIKSNQVILAGESYGGTRTTAVINVLLNVADYAQKNRVFYDQALFNEIAAHFQEIDPSVSGMPSKEAVAKQFGGQIMIQPLAMGQQQLDAIGEVLEQNDSPLYEIQQETGRKYSPCGNSSWNCDKYNKAVNYVRNAGRDIYSYRREYNWLFDYTDYGIAKITKVSMFGQFILNDPTKIENLYAANRTGAFRYGGSGGFSRNIADLDKLNVPESIKIILKARLEQRNAHPLSTGDFESVFGTLPSYDEYYLDTSDTILSTFYNASVDPYSDVNGEMFLENIKTVRTFITNAEEDIILYARATPEAAKSFSSVSSVETGNESFTVHFKDGQSAFVTFPFYPESSHSVSVNQPEKFFKDVKNWLN